MKLKDEEKDYEFIDQNWEALAVTAWQGYLDLGRGALVFGALSKDYPVYITAAKLKQKPLLRELAQFIEDYEPSEEVVVAFLRRPHDVRVYRGGIATRGTPPQLYDRVKATGHSPIT